MSQSAKKSYRILVVDDEPSVRGAYRLMLKHFGHQAQIVRDGTEALKLLETESFDIVITDYLMPDMRGDHLAASIKQQRPEQRVIMVTAFGAEILDNGELTDGVDVVLGKPFSMDELRAAIAKVMG